MLQESFWPRTEKRDEQKVLPSSAIRSGVMLPRLARRLTDVSSMFFRSFHLLFWLTKSIDGYGHLILRVEFAKRAT